MNLIHVIDSHTAGEPTRLVAVAVMTDTDDTGESATAWYDAITLRSRE